MKSFFPLMGMACIALNLIFPLPSYSESKPLLCTVYSERGEVCWAEISNIHPTQIPIGEIEVRQKEKEVRSVLKDPEKFERFQKANRAPAVMGADGRVYIIDHHHLTLGFHFAGVEDTLVEIYENFSYLSSQSAFWDEMDRRKWVYRYDELGQGPVPFSRIPDRIVDLKNDPYRSLASATRRIGGYNKVEIPFVEFTWANFFRTRIKIGPTQNDFDRAVGQAYDLARSDAAKGLPGHKGSKEGKKGHQRGCFGRLFGC